MKVVNFCKIFAVSFVLMMNVMSTTVYAVHGHQAMKKHEKQNNECKDFSITCSKTVTSAFAPNGDLWRVWVIDEAMYYQISPNNGESFGKTQQVPIPKERISARNENRPKIAFDNQQGVYLSWATPREKKYTADVRFSYSLDYGQSFSMPITVNNDNVLAGHSFNEMLVSASGEVSIVWLDGRLGHALRKQGKKAKGSELYYGVATPREGRNVFTNASLATDTCVCCRIAMDYNTKGELAILWRHIYGDNIREFAVLTVSSDKNTQPEPVQVSYDHWKINGCPHQGGGISVDEKNQYHLVWFNQGTKGKGIFYASSKDQGRTLSTPLSIGDNQAQAAHPHVMKNHNVVDIVWTQFTGIEHQLWHQQSTDHGKTFGEAKQISVAKSGFDRPFIVKKQGQNFVSWQRPKQGHLVVAL